MCGIVGYIGAKDSVPIIMDSLRRLAHRRRRLGYCGIVDDPSSRQQQQVIVSNRRPSYREFGFTGIEGSEKW
jgi:glucosamine 6-phosphate synthetase-like amidotransferase/phosphosugar isomerase protein